MKIKVTLMSDTHTKERNVLVNGGDLILHSGDVMNSGYEWEDLYDFLTWFSELPYKMKVFIPGNHDRYIEDKPFDAWKMIREFNDKGVICLIDDFVEFEGLKIYGSPLNIPSSGINNITVYTGGVPAKYGDSTGGYVIIDTKSFRDAARD